MINKKSFWTVCLFSLILVVGVYYVTMPNDIIKATIQPKIKSKKVNEIISALKIEEKEEKDKKIKELESVLKDVTKSKDEKNNAYEKIKEINVTKSKENDLMNKIKDKYKIDNFVKINEDKVEVTLIKDEKDEDLAINIMKLIQDNYKEKMYISIKFQNKK